MPEDSIELEAHGLSEIGKVREDNQDALRSYTPSEADVPGFLFAVADGMGGYEYGGVASAQALETFISTAAVRLSSDPPQAMKKGVQDANLRVYQESVRLKARMGTTLTGVYLTGSTLHSAHVGDSRAYLIRDGKAACLTDDHTRVGEMVRARVLSPDKVRHHAQRSVLNRCLGMELFVQPDITHALIRSGDVIMLCSDGLWSAVEDDEIAAIVGSSHDPEAITAHLIESALDHDSDDNISAWTICVRHAPNTAQEKRRAWSLPGLLRGRPNASS